MKEVAKFTGPERVVGLVAEVVCLKMLEELAFYMHGRVDRKVDG